MLSKCWGSLDGQALGIAVGKASQALGKARATSNFVAAELRTLELGVWEVGQLATTRGITTTPMTPTTQGHYEKTLSPIEHD